MCVCFVLQTIAEARIEITKNRQLCYLAACMADEKGFKAARNYIAMIKVSAPRMALKVVDDAIQVRKADVCACVASCRHACKMKVLS